MNCLLSGAIVRIGGAQKRADGVAGAKYSPVMSRPASAYANIAAAGRTAVNFFLIINSSLKICFSVLDDLIITFPSPYFYFYIALFCYYLAVLSVFLQFRIYIFQHFIFFPGAKHSFIVYFNSFLF